MRQNLVISTEGRNLSRPDHPEVSPSGRDDRRVRIRRLGLSGDRLFTRIAFLFVIILTASAAVLSPCRATAQEIRAWVDKDMATLEDQIVLVVSISNGSPPPEGPILPPLPEFQVLQGGSSSRVEIVNFRKSSSVEYTYFLRPKRAGTFTIGPVRISRNGQDGESSPIQVKILPTDQNPQERPAVFITQEVDIRDPYFHQQIVYTFRFFQRERVLEAQWDTPDFGASFWVEELGKERQYEAILGGQRYAVTEIRRALYPTTTGAMEIPACSLTCKLVQARKRSSGPGGIFDDDFFSDSFFGGVGQAVAKVLRADPVPLNVRPLPPNGQPDGFRGLVGVFEISAGISDKEIRRGDSTTLTVTVEGDGNLRDLVAVGPEEIAGFKTYPDKPSLELRTQGNSLVSSRVFKKALVPLEEGTMEVPSMQIAFFDPAKGAYRIARTDPIPLTVEKGEQTESLPLVPSAFFPASKTKIQILGQDILPVHRGPTATRSQAPRGKRLVPYALAAMIPPILFLVFFATKRRRERLEGDPHLVRRKEARKRADHEITAARKQIDSADTLEFYSHLARGIKGIIGDKLNLSAMALTPSEIRSCLERKGLPEDAVDGIHAFLEELEYRQYVSSSSKSDERESLLRKARGFVAVLDGKL